MEDVKFFHVQDMFTRCVSNDQISIYIYFVLQFKSFI